MEETTATVVKEPDVNDIEIILPIVDPYTGYLHLVLSGGSTKGIAHIGAVQRLIDLNLLNLSKLKSITGSSVGSIIGCLFAIGFTPSEVWEFIFKIDLKKIVEPNILLFITKCGVDTGKIMFNLIEEILTKKTGIKHINFKQLYVLTGITLTAVGTCLTDRKAVYYNHINTPTFKVSMAIRISMGIPCFFVPIDIDGKKYIDGCILNNYPMNIYDSKNIDLFPNSGASEGELERTIGILIRIDYNTSYTCPEEYLRALMHLFMFQYYIHEEKTYLENTIRVNKNLDNLSPVSFDLSDEMKQNIYQAGIDAVDVFHPMNRSDGGSSTNEKNN